MSTIQTYPQYKLFLQRYFEWFDIIVDETHFAGVVFIVLYEMPKPKWYNFFKMRAFIRQRDAMVNELKDKIPVGVQVRILYSKGVI